MLRLPPDLHQKLMEYRKSADLSFKDKGTPEYQREFSQALTEVSALAPDCLLAGWGVQNEWDFLNANLSRLNLPYFYSHHLLEISTLAFAKLYSNPQVQFLNLKRVAEYFKIPLDNHKPDSDIRATYEIFKKLI